LIATDQSRPAGYVVSVTIDGGVELYDVAIPTVAEAELAVGKYLQLSDLVAVNAIEPSSAAAVTALGTTPINEDDIGNVPLRLRLSARPDHCTHRLTMGLIRILEVGCYLAFNGIDLT
jgi:hypothetical protein